LGIVPNVGRYGCGSSILAGCGIGFVPGANSIAHATSNPLVAQMAAAARMPRQNPLSSIIAQRFCKGRARHVLCITLATWRRESRERGRSQRSSSSRVVQVRKRSHPRRGHQHRSSRAKRVHHGAPRKAFSNHDASSVTVATTLHASSSWERMKASRAERASSRFMKVRD
jgi:hypothetical protein